jgi:Family of unknown function (DUF6855)
MVGRFAIARVRQDSRTYTTHERESWPKPSRTSADEQKTPAQGTVEAWARVDDNPVGGFYGLKKGLRERFGMYVPPLMERLGLAELEHNPCNNRMRARPGAG